MAKPSPGAVDNGTAVAVLMELSKELKETPLEKTAVTIVLFAAEELNAQGSQAYLRDHPRGEAIPAYNVNLELVAQEGDYVYWPEDGVFTNRYPTSAELNRILGGSLRVTEKRSAPGGLLYYHQRQRFFSWRRDPSTTLGNAGSRS